MRNSNFFIVFLIFVPCLTLSLMNFPKIIWMYWETDFEKAPLITKVSFEKTTAAAKQVGWTVNLVTGKNIHEYISDMKEFQNVVRRGRRQTVQQKSDLLRIWLVEQNGGVWIDFAAIPYENFNWLMNYTSYQHLIINRVGSNLQDPDMLMFGQGSHQSPLSHYNSDGQLVTDQFFGMAIHFIAAKKKARIMTQWKQKMKLISAMTYEQMLPQWKQNRLFFHTIDRDDVYYSGNIALETVIQIKQLQLDKNLTLFSERKSVYEHYKIWGIHGQVGPIGLIRKHIFKPSDLFLFTRQQIENRINQQRFYLKIAAYLRHQIEQHQNLTRKYFQESNKTIEQIIKQGPSKNECQLWFIVQDSIIHNFYKDSKYFDQLKVPIITVEQRDILRKHCMSVNPEDYKPIYEIHSAGQFVSPQKEIYSKDNSLSTQIWVWWTTHYVTFHLWIFKYRETVMLLVFYGVLKLIFSKYIQKILDKNNSLIRKNDLSNPQTLELNEIISNLSQEKQQTKIKSSKLKYVTILCIFFAGLMHMTFYQIFDCIEQFGRFPVYDSIAFMAFALIVFNTAVRMFINQNNLHREQRCWFVPLQTIIFASRPFLLMYAGHCVLVHFHVISFYAYRDVLQIVGMGYLLYVIFYELQSRKLADNKVHQFIVYFIKKILSWTTVIFLCLIVFWRNPMYLTSDDHYMRLGFINGLRDFFQIFSKLSITYFIILLVKNIYQSIKQIETKNQKSSILKFQESTIFLFSTILWIWTFWKISFQYDRMQQNPKLFDQKMFMKYFMVHFAVFSFAIKIKIPQSLNINYKIILYLVLFAYIVAFCIIQFEYFMNPIIIKINQIVLTLILAFLALTRQILINQQKKISQQRNDSYKTIDENSDILMTSLKMQDFPITKK